MDDDKVDLVIGGYGTNTMLPAMPLIMERQRFFVGLDGSRRQQRARTIRTTSR